MKDFLDRQPTKAGRRKLTYGDGTSEFVTVEMADEPTREGTPLNREAFMALQGFQETKTVFNDDGSITETNEKGETLVTVFDADGSITKTFTNVEGVSISLKTTFQEDGSIAESFV
ncbi:hypothetical protein [Anaerotignum sp.]|nr:hypothetical protein [Anaerotignum sp.]MCI5680183.1 hypothetical protein [Bacteroidales bacterium]MDY3926874.1 hypothetical protein [Anaerotignum sp.]